MLELLQPLLALIPKPLLLVALLAAGALIGYDVIHIDHLTADIYKEQKNVADLKAEIARGNAATAEERAQAQSDLVAAVTAGNLRERKLASDAANAKSALDGLRIAVTQAGAGFGLHAPGQNTSASADYAATAGELLDQCAARYTDVAAKADGHSSDVKTLTDAWPKE